MFLRFYISLRKVLNLRELFMIFQKKQKYLRKIKRNEISEIEKGNIYPCIIFLHRSFPFFSLYSYLFTIANAWSPII